MPVIILPSSEDYTKAVQRPDAFVAPELARAVFAVDPVWQVPRPAKGTSAVVFKTVLDGQDQALRFFIRPDASDRLRYTALQEHFVARGLIDHVAATSWVDRAIRIDGQVLPAVRMEWVDGQQLNQHVETLVEEVDTAALGGLARRWRDLVLTLQQADFAHGDLQHGNVLLDERDTLRLVDFDCSWIPGFASLPPSRETGNPNYQPAGRPWGPWMDTFPGLLVYTSLVALSKNPRPWSVLDTGDNMLFRSGDFTPPLDTPVWRHLAGVRDEELNLLVARLRECCLPNWQPRPLEQLLAPRVLPWWERTARPVPPGPVPVGPVPVGPVPVGPVPPGPAPFRSGPDTDPTIPPPRQPPGAAPPPLGPGQNWWNTPHVAPHVAVPPGAVPPGAVPPAPALRPVPAGPTPVGRRSPRVGRGLLAGVLAAALAAAITSGNGLPSEAALAVVLMVGLLTFLVFCFARR